MTTYMLEVVLLILLIPPIKRVFIEPMNRNIMKKSCIRKIRERGFR